MEIDYEQLGNRIRDLRETRHPKKVSREKLAEFVGVNAVSVYRWENNGGKPELDHLIKVGQFFNLTLPELLQIDGAAKSDMIVSVVALLPSLNESELRNVLAVIESSPSISGATTRGLAR